jgi:hypothetical protein
MEAALTENTYGDLVFENIEDGETVHQVSISNRW